MPTVLCTCGRDVWFDASATGRVVCPHCGESAEATDLRFPVSLWLLVALTSILLPAWIRGEMAYREVNGELYAAPVEPILRATLSPWLPVALALLLSVRAGGLNLSVWGCTSLGAVTCWAVLSFGWGPPPALGAAIAAGGLVGAAILTVCRRWKPPIWLIAAAAGCASMFGSRWIAGKLTPLSPDRIEQMGFAAVSMMFHLVLFLAPMAVVTIVYNRIRAADNLDRRAWRWPALTVCLGCCLSAVAGCTMVLASGRHSPHGWLISDLRVLSAVVLCGGWVWRGRGGLGLACLLLPLALLVSTMWTDTIGIWLPGIRFTWPLLLLIALVAGSQLVSRGRGRRWTRRLAALATAVGVLIVAAGAYWPVDPVAVHLAILGGLVWSAGVAVGLNRLIALRNGRRPT